MHMSCCPEKHIGFAKVLFAPRSVSIHVNISGVLVRGTSQTIKLTLFEGNVKSASLFINDKLILFFLLHFCFA